MKQSGGAKAGRGWDGTEYLRKHQLLPFQITAAPDPGLSLVIAIPARDEPDLVLTLESLRRCDRPAEPVEIVVGLNLSEDSPPDALTRHGHQLATAREIAKRHSAPGYRIHVVDHPALPQRQAGVGLARKLIMDEAVARLCAAGRPEGVIACLDADCVVAPNYVRALANHFEKHPKTPACSIYFEHPLETLADNPRRRRGIVCYELHLRYFVHALRYARFPHAFQTVGSSMAVRCDAYQKVGGMNRRQGAEDFHFLSKMLALGAFSELTSTTVYPAPRISHRVPFGTGRAMAEWAESTDPGRLTYPIVAFDCLRTLCRNVGRLREMPPCAAREIPWLCPDLRRYLDECGFKKRLEEIQANAALPGKFEKRFFRWVNGLRVVKFLNYMRELGQPQDAVERAAASLLQRAGVLNSTPPLDPEALLRIYRDLDRQGLVAELE